MSLGFVAIIVIAIVALLVLPASIFGVVILLMKLGVIVQKATEPPIEDQGCYDLDQGQEVGKN